MSTYKEFDNLPEELQVWGKQALCMIESPEKRHEAAGALRQKIDNMWNECSLENQKEKTAYVLSKLGDAGAAAKEMKEAYALKTNPKKDRIIGVAVLILSALCTIYPYRIFFVVPNMPEGIGWMAMYRTRIAAGAGAAAAFGLFVLGVAILLNARKK